MRSNQFTFRFSSQRLALVALGLLFPLALAFSCRPVFAQGFSVENKSAPSVVEGVTFVSLEAKFTIALPQTQQGFRPLSIDTPVGRATGDAYSWTMKEGVPDAAPPTSARRDMRHSRSVCGEHP